ncbi:putative quinone oxidoreductase [Podospora fimiseda]|uniref:Quinone oxidoreductase n=1 Tax=Podospora fimiseda TaxID=252190 RepID=A0AAN7H0U5_9PEZI|nr:putative quinone oxidoreductase [Podospora fimiseda]
MPQTLTIKPVEGAKPGKVYYPLQLNTLPQPPAPGPNQVLVNIRACALNHRDLFIRQHLYPGISFTSPLLADGYGVVTALGPSPSPRAQSLLDQPVLLTPSRGWESNPAGPENNGKEFSVVGGSSKYDYGTAQDYIVLPESEVFLAPEHLTPAEGAALPLTGLTGWRALVTKAEAKKGENVLITGIGGGVALQVLQFAVALGCNVFVTSGSQEKIDKAKQLGAKGGVVYKDSDWEKQLQKMLPGERAYLDCVIDGAGGDILARAGRLLKTGGRLVVYGMTTGPKMEWNMTAVLKNVELKGTSMGSRKEFGEMIEFVREHKIRPVVSRVVEGGLGNLEGIDGLFEDMKKGVQFGKLVILFDGEKRSGERSPKL